jgi:site-specific DNA-cytosine methylase
MTPDGAGSLALSAPPARIRPALRPLVIDSFAGGGGASTGIEWALGRSPDFAINHDPKALAMHAANHPDTVHLTENIWKVDPHAVKEGRVAGPERGGEDAPGEEEGLRVRAHRRLHGSPRVRVEEGEDEGDEGDEGVKIIY